MQVVLSITKGSAALLALAEVDDQQPQNTLYHAFAELGRVVRTTLHLEVRFQTGAAFWDSGSHDQNRSVSGFLWLGLLWRRQDRFGHAILWRMKRIKYKDLVANAIMLHNVVEYDRRFTRYATRGYAVTAELVATLSPI